MTTRPQHPTASKLRHDIDRGRGGDKVDAIDPAAAPLGTDDEAAGTPVPPEAVAMAYAQEIGSSPASKDGGITRSSSMFWSSARSREQSGFRFGSPARSEF
jgi:hypothetical protein